MCTSHYYDLLSSIINHYEPLLSMITGVVKCPMTWVYWTSPEKVAI